MNETAPIHVLDHKVSLFQAENGFRTSMDSVFVAAACPARGNARVLDMGAGVGGASFCLLWREKGVFVTGVEIQQSHVDLANRNIALNDCKGRAEFIAADVIALAAEQPFDHVMCNPPYLEAGHHTVAANKEKALAMGHESADLKAWVDAGFRNLKSGGSFTMIQRADMTDKIILALGKRFGAIQIIPLYPKQGEQAKRVIIRAVKDRKSPAILHAGIILHETDGKYTMHADKILRDGAGI